MDVTGTWTMEDEGKKHLSPEFAAIDSSIELKADGSMVMSNYPLTKFQGPTYPWSGAGTWKREHKTGAQDISLRTDEDKGSGLDIAMGSLAKLFFYVGDPDNNDRVPFVRSEDVRP